MLLNGVACLCSCWYAKFLCQPPNHWHYHWHYHWQSTVCQLPNAVCTAHHAHGTYEATKGVSWVKSRVQFCRRFICGSWHDHTEFMLYLCQEQRGRQWRGWVDQLVPAGAGTRQLLSLLAGHLSLKRCMPV